MKIGHYTQLVWADTYLVGCGVASFKDPPSVQSPRYNLLIACNYGPGGNFVGSPVYKQGKAGTACPVGTKATSQGLCA
jgi:hypothetical protein